MLLEEGSLMLAIPVPRSMYVGSISVVPEDCEEALVEVEAAVADVVRALVAVEVEDGMISAASALVRLT
jgi:hypothetical protein